MSEDTTEIEAIRRSFEPCGARCTCGVQYSNPDVFISHLMEGDGEADAHFYADPTNRSSDKPGIAQSPDSVASRSRIKRIRVQQGLPMYEEDE